MKKLILLLLTALLLPNFGKTQTTNAPFVLPVPTNANSGIVYRYYAIATNTLNAQTATNLVGGLYSTNNPIAYPNALPFDITSNIYFLTTTNTLPGLTNGYWALSSTNASNSIMWYANPKSPGLFVAYDPLGQLNPFTSAAEYLIDTSSNDVTDSTLLYVAPGNLLTNQWVDLNQFIPLATPIVSFNGTFSTNYNVGIYGVGTLNMNVASANYASSSTTSGLSSFSTTSAVSAVTSRPYPTAYRNVPLTGWNSYLCDTGPNFSSGANEQAMTNALGFYVSMGLSPGYYDTFMFDYNPYTGVPPYPLDVSSNLIVSTSGWGSADTVAGLAQLVHSAGAKFWWWMPSGFWYQGSDYFTPSIASASQYTLTTNINTFVFKYGIDGLSLDGVANEMMATYELNAVRDASRRAGRYIQVNINSGTGSALGKSPGLSQWITAGDGFDNFADGLAGTAASKYLQWTNNMDIFAHANGYQYYSTHRNFPMFSTLQLFQGDTNMLIGALSQMATIPMGFFLNETNYIAQNVTMPLILTNNLFFSILKDSAAIPGEIEQDVTTNGCVVWARNLGSGNIAVSFLNTSTNGSSKVVNVNWNDLKLPANYQVTVSNVWSGAASIVSNSFSDTIGLNTGNLYLFILSKSYTGNFTGNGGGLMNVTVGYLTNIVNGITNINNSTRIMTWSVPVIVTVPATTLGNAEIDAQLLVGSAWVTVDDLRNAAGVTSVIETNSQNLNFDVYPGQSYRITNSVSGTGYTAGLDAGKTNQVKFY